jgi:uncharacterized protein
MMARMTPERFGLETPKGTVTAVWHPAGGTAAMVVAHGAGAGLDHPFIEGFCEALAAEGVAALRFNFPYMEAGRRTPDAAANAIGAFGAAAREATARNGGRPVAGGGKSYGGRIASMAAAEGTPLTALAFLGYPLHPPGSPEKARDAHLYELRVPLLFLQGTKDPFAQPAVLDRVLERLGERARHVAFDGAGHSFELTRRDDARAIGASLAPTVAAFVREHGR